MMQDLEQLLSERRAEIIDIVSGFETSSIRSVTVFGSNEKRMLKEGDSFCDVSILINFDERDEDDIGIIVCIHPPKQPWTEHMPGRIPDFALMEQLEKLLGCVVDIVDEVALQNFFPKTYDCWKSSLCQSL